MKEVLISKRFGEIAEVEYPIFGRIEKSKSTTYIKVEEDWITKITTYPSSLKIEKILNEGVLLDEWISTRIPEYEYKEAERYVLGFLSI